MNGWQEVMVESFQWPVRVWSMAAGWMSEMMGTMAAAAVPPTQNAAPTPAAPPSGRGATSGARKETAGMRDRDLSGHDVKLVRYRILFVKREYEAAFPETDDLLTYATRPEEYGGLKVAEFMGRAYAGEVPQPEKWARKDYPGDDHGTPQGGWSIPSDDRQYVRFYFEVLDRFPREKAEYDKEQVQVLRDISAKIG